MTERHVHKTAALQSSTGPGGEVLWRCNRCGRWVVAVDAYYGEWSCTLCAWRAIEWVACSRWCMRKLIAG